MTHTRRLQLKTIPLIVISIILGPLGNVFLGKAMKRIGPLPSERILDLLPVAPRVLMSSYIWLGVACLLGFFIVHMLLLTWADYSYVQPATSLSYASVTMLSSTSRDEKAGWGSESFIVVSRELGVMSLLWPLVK